MDVDALGKSPIGKLVPIGGLDPRTSREWKYWAYLPDNLPEHPALSAKALNASAKAAMSVARLDEAVSQLPRPEIIVRPIVRREAASTSALEGTYASFDEVLEADFLEDREMSSEQREIRNYTIATEAAVKQVHARRISRTFLGELQRTIVRGTRGDTPDAGDLRPHQVAIGPHNSPIEESRFVPCPPGDQLEAGVLAWQEWVEGDNHVLIIAKMALAHYQFETLHPFGDGNGRLGRLVALLQLMRVGELKYPVLSIAPWFESRRQQYQDGLLAVSITGDFNPWVLFFAEAVDCQAREGLERIRRLLALRDDMVTDVRESGLRGSSVELAELIIGYPVIDVPTVKALIGKSFEAANQAVARLVDKGLLREITGRRQNRLFVCPAVLEATRWN